MLNMKEDWIECTLNDIAIWGSGGTPKSTNTDYYNGDIPWLIIGDLNDSYVNESEKKITKLGLENSSAKLVKPNSVLIAMYGSIGKLGINKIEVSTNQAIAFTKKLHTGIFNKYLFHYLYYCRPTLHSLGKGGTQKNISQTVLKMFEFPLAPLPIQQAIVKKIEELFSSLDSGIADLKKAQDQLMIYRQAVLSSCLPKNEKIEISELVENLSQGWSPKCINQNSTDSNQWAVIKTSAIQAGKFVESENKILPDTLEPREQHEIKKGDILITRAGPRVRVGICCLVKKTRPKLINCDKVYRIELNQELVTPEYFEYAINSPEILSEIEIMKSGSSDSGLNLTQKRFLKLEIPICSKEEQHQIVQEIESRLSVCDKVEKDIADSMEKAQALRQSILKKAFEGKLLSEEEIAACKQHKDYEPASVLLERIKKEN